MQVRRASVILAVALVAGAAQLVAQQGPPRGGRGFGAPSVEELKTALNLSPEQSDRVGGFIATWDKETKVARETLMANFQAMQQGGDVEALRAENMMAMQHVREKSEALNGQIRGVLSPEQSKAFDAWIAERAQRMRQGRPGGPPPALR
jgi:Spy/CpxP family protein refolding chaperone